jgi:hypothetical protein
LQSSLRLETPGIDTIWNGDRIMTAEMCVKLRDNHSGNTRQMDLLPPVDTALKPAGQSIIEAAMEEPGPTSGGRVPEEQLRLYPLIEFFKDDGNLNYIGIASIDPR